ncbi:hypothetical protein TNCV_1176391 [Trichonephila clavipes]|nr:hypothetical protein TNCV_1176391 [Trichonephila clavipes]
MWAANYLNENECQPVVIKTYPQCQIDRAIYSAPDSKLGSAPKLVSDALVYCLGSPMELRLKRGGPCKDLLHSPIRDDWGRDSGPPRKV